MNNGQESGSVPRLAWVGVGITALLVVVSAILVARIILGLDDGSRVWLPITALLIMTVVAAVSGWSIGSALQRRRDQGE